MSDYGFWYSHPLGRLLQPMVVAWAYVSRALGWFYDTRISTLLIRPFIKYYGIKVEDFQMTEFRSFNEFFVRKIKPETRPINRDPQGLIAPADSRLTVCDYVSKKSLFPIKQVPFNLAKLLDSEELADEFCYGTLLAFRLAVDDYHRFHFPCDGVARAPTKIPGKYHTVRPGIYEQGIMPLQENYRELVRFHSDTYGDMIIMPVGALGVSRIVQTYKPGRVNKGDEMGYFQFGGSEVIILLKSQPIRLHKAGRENRVWMGEGIATHLG